MDTLVKLLSSEALDAEIVSGISYGFALIFFAPLLMVVVAFSIYCMFSSKSVLRTAKILSFTWLVASMPTALLITMGYAFNSDKMNPLLAVPLWIMTGLIFIWLPVAARALFRGRSV
jgi:hypothetical protein